MKYLPLLLLLAAGACAEHHELTQCKGPYLALNPPPPPVAEAPKAAVPLVPARPPATAAGNMPLYSTAAISGPTNAVIK